MNALRAPGLALLVAALLAGAAGCAPAEEAPAALTLSEGWIRLPPQGRTGARPTSPLLLRPR